MDHNKQRPATFVGGSKVNNMLVSETPATEEVVEQFPDPIVPDLTLMFNWTIWEQYESKYGEDYKKSMAKVAWFGDAVTFWQIWNKIPHADPTNFFSYNVEGKKYANHYEINGFEQRVTTLSMFKTDILPQWEDPANKLGGDFNMKVNCDREKTKDIWNNLVLDIVSGTFPHSERLTGIRLVDKVKFLKIEAWVDYAHKDDFEGSKDQEGRLSTLLINCGIDSQKIDFSSHN